MSKMFVYVCDKCKDTIDESERRSIVVDGGTQYDFCKMCYHSFTDWLNKNPKWQANEPVASVWKTNEPVAKVKKETKEEVKEEKKPNSEAFIAFFERHENDIFEPKYYERIVGRTDHPVIQKLDANKSARTKFIHRMQKMEIVTIDDFLTRFDSERHFLADLADGKQFNSETTKYYKNIYAIILRFVEFDYGPGKINRFQKKFLEDMDKKLAEEHAKECKEK